MAIQGSKQLFLSALSVFAYGATAIEAQAQSSSGTQVAAVHSSMSAEILPPAKSGECYAKVRVPAKYRTDMIDVRTKESTDRYTITAAKFENRTKRVMTKEASSTLKAIQPELAVEKDSFLVAPATTRWVRNSLSGTSPVSEGERRDLSLAGVKLEEVGAGSCLYEHYRPATTKEVPNQVLISEATEQLSTVQASYRKASESVLTRPSHKRLIAVPASYKKKSERVLVEPATTVWQVGEGPIMRIDRMTGEIMCRIDVPAVYKTVDTEVIDTAPLVTSVTEKAEFKTVSIEKLEADAKEVRTPKAAQFQTMNKEQIQDPGGYTWLTSKTGSAADGKHTGRVVCHAAVPAKQIAYERTVVKTAGRFERTKVDATFENVAITELVTDARSVKLPVPGVTSKFERRTKISDSGFEWAPILCETNTTGDIVTRIQAALKKEGFAPGSVDGVLGRSTIAALEAYQRKNKLAEGGVTMEALQALGVEL